MRKTKKLTATILSVVACSLLLMGCSTSKNVELSVTINDNVFALDSTVQDLYDAGFVLCDTGAGNIISDNELPEFEARTVDNITSYYVGLPTSNTKAEYTGISIQVYNNSSKSCSLKDCCIFSYCYKPNSEFYAESIKVLINGTNFCGLTPQQGVTAMEGFGITFEEEDKAEFLEEEDGGFLITSSGRFTYSLNSDLVIEYADDESYTENVLIDEIEFQKKMDIDYN